jgi:hypothetical protein
MHRKWKRPNCGLLSSDVRTERDKRSIGSATLEQLDRHLGPFGDFGDVAVEVTHLGEY